MLLIAQGLGGLKLGDASLDGTKIQAHASKHAVRGTKSEKW
jgi:hypothetical protein